MRNRLTLQTIGFAAGLFMAITGYTSRVAAQQVLVTGETTRLTFSPGTAIDPTISTDVVAWTGNETGSDDIYYCRLDACLPRPLTAIPGDQRLHDVDGTVIVYTDQFAPPEQIHAFDVASENNLGVVSVDNARNPRIDGALVAYEVGLTGETRIWVTNLTTGSMFPITASAQIETNPVVSGTRVVFERLVTTAGPSAIVVYDLATGVESLITDYGDYRRPDIDGTTIVYDGRTADGGLDIFIHDLASGVTTRFGGSGDQMYPHVSGDVISFDNIVATDDRDVMLRHIPSNTSHPVATNRGPGQNDFLNDIRGNRIAYTSNVSGGFEIYIYTFDITLADIAVAPLEHDFGDVTLGASGTTIVTVSNVGNLALTVTDVAFENGSSFAFTIQPALAFPTIIEPGQTLDVTVAFAPVSAGPATASLSITNDDVDEGVVQVTLSGRGVASSETPLQQIADLLGFLDGSVANGSLTGNGPGNSSQGRLNALRNMIEAAGDLIQNGSLGDACAQLLAAYRRTDGIPQPPDFVTGSAAAELAGRIRRLRDALGCL